MFLKILRVAAVTAVIACCLSVQAGEELPADSSGAAFGAWLEALAGAENEGTLRNFISARFSESFLAAFPVAQHVALHRRLFSDTGGLEPVQVVDKTDGNLVVLCRARRGGWMKVSMVIEPAPPHAIDGVRFAPSDPPEVAAKGPAADETVYAAALTTFVEELVAEDRFSGAVLVVHDGRPVVSGAWGEASRRFHVPNRPDTRFNLGSMNKMLTAVAIAQLAEQGKLSFDDPVGKHLPDLANEAVRTRVTLRHLLTHTSGMGSHFTDEFMNASKMRYRDFKDYLPLFVGEPLAFEPGSRVAYSNAGFLVLGMIVEAVSGQAYDDYIRDHVTGPAGMTATDCFEMDLPVENLAIGYTRRAPGVAGSDGEWRNNLFLHSIKGGPAGGGFSTVGDLGRFAQALVKGRLLSADMVATLTSPKVEMFARDGERHEYGYGFAVVRDAAGRTSFGHGGGFAGINSELAVFPASGWTIAVMSNIDGGAMPVVRHARRLLPLPEGAGGQAGR